jgi:hypothetical protein
MLNYNRNKYTNSYHKKRFWNNKNKWYKRNFNKRNIKKDSPKFRKDTTIINLIFNSSIFSKFRTILFTISRIQGSWLSFIPIGSKSFLLSRPSCLFVNL